MIKERRLYLKLPSPFNQTVLLRTRHPSHKNLFLVDTLVSLPFMFTVLILGLWLYLALRVRKAGRRGAKGAEPPIMKTLRI